MPAHRDPLVNSRRASPRDGRYPARRAWAAILSTLALYAGSAAALGQSALSGHDAMERLRAGEVLVEDVRSDQGVEGLRAMFLVRASPRAVWDLLTDYQHYREVFTNVEDLDILEQTNQGARIHFTVKAAWLHFHYTLQRDYTEPGRRLTWRRVAGDFKNLAGEWLIQDGPDGDHTIVTCESFVDLGFLVPSALVRDGATAEMKSTMHRLRDRLEGQAK
jgi:ribosome-associated toxin RatA of RatAB toxin-antitoxin module